MSGQAVAASDYVSKQDGPCVQKLDITGDNDEKLNNINKICTDHDIDHNQFLTPDVLECEDAISCFDRFAKEYFKFTSVDTEFRKVRKFVQSKRRYSKYSTELDQLVQSILKLLNEVCQVKLTKESLLDPVFLRNALMKRELLMLCICKFSLGYSLLGQFKAYINVT